MKSAVETLSPTRAKLTVEVPFEELKPSLDAAYRKIAQQINVPGFRKGKVPAAIIDRQVGRGAVLDEAINDALPQLYVQALQENDLEPLAQPEVDITRLDDNESLEFTAEVDVRPEIELPSYDGVEAEVEDVEVSDADVEEQVEALRERFATLIDVERPAAEGDFVVMDLVATKDGEPVEGAEVSGMSYRVGRGGMLSYETRHCRNGNPAVAPAGELAGLLQQVLPILNQPAPVGPPNPLTPAPPTGPSLAGNILNFVFANSGRDVGNVPCRSQGPFTATEGKFTPQGETTQYPHVREARSSTRRP